VQAAVSTRTAFNLLRLSAVVAWSIVPVLAQKILCALGEDSQIPAWPTQSTEELLLQVGAGRLVAPIGPLIAKLEATDVDRLSRRFAGNQSNRG
jgi:methionyl-tRNA synthetase